MPAETHARPVGGEAYAMRVPGEKVRAADRAAQGITPGHEETGAMAVRHARTLAGGLLTVVTLPHNRCAVVADRMEEALGGPATKISLSSARRR